MLDHIGLVVADYAKSKQFFEKALTPPDYCSALAYYPDGNNGLAMSHRRTDARDQQSSSSRSARSPG